MIKVIDKFDGEFDWLSNFFSCPIVFDGLTFQSSEAAYQAAKTLDLEERQKFTSVNAGKSKRMGRKVTLREDWDVVKIHVMRCILQCKFTQNPELAKKLIDTGDAELIEGNWWHDKFWGVCGGVCRGKK